MHKCFVEPLRGSMWIAPGEARCNDGWISPTAEQLNILAEIEKHIQPRCGWEKFAIIQHRASPGAIHIKALRAFPVKNNSILRYKQAVPDGTEL
jgi:hypothetical protein